MLFLSVGTTCATNAVSNSADITAATGTVLLAAGDGTSLLMLTANDNTKAGSAWIEEHAPLNNYPPAGGGSTCSMDSYLLHGPGTTLAPGYARNNGLPSSL
jgi:hypothetical protein